MIAVLRGATAHTAGIIGDDAADLGRIDRRRIRADLALQRGQQRVGGCSDNARLQANALAAVKYLPTVPMVAQYNQYRIADGLA